MQLTMDDTNVEWLDQKPPINHPFKGFGPTNTIPTTYFSKTYIWT